MSTLEIEGNNKIGGDVAIRLRVNGTPPEPILSCEYILLYTKGYVRNITVDDELPLIVKCMDQFGEDINCSEIGWSNSNESVGTVENSTFIALVPGETTIYATGVCSFENSNRITLIISENGIAAQEYLTDEEFQERMAELNLQLDEMGLEQESGLNELMELLNNSGNLTEIIIKHPSDAVSYDTFNESMDAFSRKIDDINTKNSSFLKKIIDAIKEIFS